MASTRLASDEPRPASAKAYRVLEKARSARKASQVNWDTNKQRLR